MASENIVDAIGDIARDKGISRERLVEVIQEAITAAAKRKFRQYEDIETRLNVTSGEIEVFRYKRVAETVEDAENEISLEEARRLDSLAEPGDEVEYEIENQELSRVIAQTARQLIFQKIREAERETIYENFKDRKNEILNGMVVRTERNRAVLSFNNTEAILYGRDQIPNERLSVGEHVRVILLDVLNDPKEASQLVISRTHPVLLTKLFEMEVPEIYDGIVEIVTAVREPGRRAKVAVISNDPDVDPVGACVGMRGSRVQAIISELRGEKIDIIKWNDDLPSYVANSLAPAELTRIKIDDEAGEIDVEVEPDQLALAIGRQGQNVRLASKLTGYKINVASTQEHALSLEEQIREKLQASQAALEAIPSAAGESAAGEAPAVGESGSAETAAGAPAEETEAVAAQTAAEEPVGEVEAVAPEPPVEESEAVSAEAAEEASAEEAEGVVAEAAEESASEVEAVAPEQPAEETEAVVAEAAEESASEVEAVAPEQPVEETEAVAAKAAEEASAEDSSTESAAAEEPAEESATAESDVPGEEGAVSAAPADGAADAEEAENPPPTDNPDAT